MGRGFTPSSDLSSTKTRPCWRVFVFDAFPVPLDARRTRKHALVGVFSCSAHFRTPDVHRPRKHAPVGVFSCSAPCLHHAQHRTTPTLVCFCARRLSCTLRRPIYTEHQNMPSLACFDARRLFCTPNAHRT